MCHPAQVINSLEELLSSVGYYDEDINPNFKIKIHRYWTRVWKRHIERNGNIPLIRKCAICSGKEMKTDIKLGHYKPSRPSKIERDENNWKKMEE